ncbi:hypothetical protein [Baekduia alba]|uniref:hypothetical protein n=1 Tax=Baekduia alba TaxID=2997333 RepID=UPI00233FFFBE|nr:hypothetical protein [Baekduia alba]
MLRSAITAVAFFALAGPASASWSPPGASQQGMLQSFLPVARVSWPGSACAGREVVQLDADAALDVADAETLQAGDRSAGRALAGSCTIEMRHITDPWMFCSVLVHEEGHLAGFGHTGAVGESQAPAGELAAVMQPVMAGFFPACDRRLTAASTDYRGRAVRWLWAALPGPYGRWVIGCAWGRCAARDSLRLWRTRVYRYRLDRGTGFMVEGPLRRPYGSEG